MFRESWRRICPNLRLFLSLLAICCLAGAALAALDESSSADKPVFAFTDKTGWVIHRRFGIDDLLPPPAAAAR